jgi:hypothetical protein
MAGRSVRSFFEAASVARKMDTAKLRSLAIKGTIQTPHDAVDKRFVGWVEI